MTADELFALLNRKAPEFGVHCPGGEEPVYWNAYFRELSKFKPETVEQAFDAWEAGEFDRKKPALAMIFPQPWQLAQLALKAAPHMLAYPSHAPFHIAPIPQHMMPSRTPAEVAQRLREMDDDVGVVL